MPKPVIPGRIAADIYGSPENSGNATDSTVISTHPGRVELYRLTVNCLGTTPDEDEKMLTTIRRRTQPPHTFDVTYGEVDRAFHPQRMCKLNMKQSFENRISGG
jgi:hypothetical protein